jgi:hypothetical protein
MDIQSYLNNIRSLAPRFVFYPERVR